MSTPTGILFDVDHFAVHDGPGIRATVYFKGCALRCAWCHSPESQSLQPELLYAQNRCVHCGLCAQVCPTGAQRMEGGRHRLDRERCTLCGACARVCPTHALTISGYAATVQDVLTEVLPDKPFFDNSGGGVTLTGGEVLLQGAFAEALLSALQNNGIHTIVETSGYGDTAALLALARYANVFYFDFKLWHEDAFRRCTGGELSVVQKNLSALAGLGAHIVLRAPLIPGLTDTEENLSALYGTAVRYGISEVHLLPYNASAGEKYAWLNRPFFVRGESQDADTLRRIAQRAPAGVRVRIA